METMPFLFKTELNYDKSQLQYNGLGVYCPDKKSIVKISKNIRIMMTFALVINLFKQPSLQNFAFLRYIKDFEGKNYPTDLTLNNNTGLIH